MPRPTIEVEQSLTHLHPEVAAMWHPTENLPLRPEAVLPGANDVVLWVCAAGHEERRRIADQVVNKVKCQGCTYIGHTHPDIAAEVDVDFEPAGVAVQLPGNSKKKLAWKCGECGHRWTDAVKDRTAPGDAGCRRCAWGRWQLGMLIAHYRAAENVSIEALANASAVEEAALIRQEAGRTLLGTGALQRIASRLGIPRPDWGCLADEAHAGPPQRGSPLFPRMRDGAFALTRTSLGSQRREFRKVLAGTNIAERHAGLLPEWHAELNAFTPSLVAPRARYNAFWLCREPECEGVWSAWVGNRTRPKRPSGCPECAKVTRAATRRATALAQGKSLAQFDREMAKELHPAKNEGRTADDFPFGCTDRILWTCSTCDHEWEATVNKRTSGRGCPECWAARRLDLIHQRVRELVESGRNLAVEYPELSEEFDTELNSPLKPQDVAPCPA